MSFSKIIKNEISFTSIFSYLDGINPKQLSDFIKDESPHTIAVILSHMDPSKSAEVLMQLDEEIRVKVTIQIATIKDVFTRCCKNYSSVLKKTRIFYYLLLLMLVELKLLLIC